MRALSYVVPFAAMQIGVVSIAVVLWLELRHAQRRQRRVRNIQSVLKAEDLCRSGEEYFKHVA